MSQSSPLSSDALRKHKARRARWLARFIPVGADTQSTNIRRVIIDSIGVGFASAAQPFLPVLLARLGATNQAIGLYSALPALGALLFGIPAGRFLQSRQRIVPWFSTARLLLISCFALTGLVAFFFSEFRVELIIAIWVLAIFPQVLLNVSFTVVMASVAGPEGRYYLMSRRWSLLGFTNAITVAIAGQLLYALAFPLNYTIVFAILSLGGLVSFYFSSHLELPAQTPPPSPDGSTARKRIANSVATVRAQPAFVRFNVSQFVYHLGWGLAIPLFPLYFVRNLNANDADIGIINTVNTGVLLIAYFLWSRISREFGTRFALLATTFGLALYPIALAFLTNIPHVVLLAGLAGIFQAGLDLVFFDTVVSTMPQGAASASFVGIYQTTKSVALFAGPLIGTSLAGFIGIPFALIVAGLVRLAGFVTFAVVFREEDHVA
ncbi:MAG: MFS transporter [Chloroflexi bacterium]|nr:MFS transporter [Chloroflexota bacterium]